MPGLTAAIQNTLSPTYWMASRYDTLDDRLRQQKCISNYNTLRGRGIPALLKIHEPFPVTFNRFWRIPGLDSVQSADIYARLQVGGYLHVRHFVNFNPKASTAQTAMMLAAYQPDFNDIDDQLVVCLTEHQFFSDQVTEVICFFDRFAAVVVTGTAPAAAVAPALEPGGLAVRALYPQRPNPPWGTARQRLVKEYGRARRRQQVRAACNWRPRQSGGIFTLGRF